MLMEIERVLNLEQPDAVLVYGDTNSTLAGALAAVKLHIPVAHVEAGLRSFNMAMPEEINRILTDRIARWLFTPTQAAQTHLQREGVPTQKIIPVGDVMYDVALHHGARTNATSGMVGRLGLIPGSYVLATMHRAENSDDLCQ
jgi:UDP-GlcNAc3NAcA epimerase